MKTIKVLYCLLLFMLNSIIFSQTTFTQAQYAEALQKSIWFYEAQQSGPLPSFNRVKWRGNSALTDGSDVGKNLTGGWYDAGDHVKFGFPMAYTATILGWGAIDFKDGYIKSGQYTAIKNNLRFVYDYFIKCHTAPNELYGQVGNGGVDHSFWGAPEIMQMPRPSYKIDQTKPGTELAMETAAALAAGSIIFATEDPAYSAILLQHAKELYNFGNTYRGKYSTSISDAASFYNSFSGFQDELVWGALWLYRATNDITYLNNAEKEYDLVGNEGQTAFKPYKFGLAWDDKIYGCYPLLAKFTGKAKYYADMERNLDFWTDGFNGERITYTPGGLAWLIQWGSLRYASNTAFVALVYGDLPNANSTKKTKYKNFAVRQINYVLGANPAGRSYVCGFGVNPPLNPHHRGAHGTWTNNLTGPPTTSRHTLYGALVGGPGVNDDYADNRNDFIKNEVATDYNAGFSGALAKILVDATTTITLPPIADEVVGEEYLTSIKSNATGSNFFEPAVRIQNHTAWPARKPAKLSFRYFIDISEGVSAGFSISNYSVALGGYAPNATLIPGFKLWTGNIYYVEVEYNNVLIFPGGQSESQRECQFRMTGPTGTWNSTNDFSFTGVTNAEAQTLYVPVYENGVLVYGNEPPRTTVNYTITATAGANGSIAPSGVSTVASGSNKTYTITPNAGYVVDAVTVSGASVGALTTYTFTNITGNKTISATFKLAPIYTITASAGSNGNISPIGTVNVTSGSNRTYTITPNNGYQVDNVLVNGVSVGAVTTYTFNNVTSNQTISVTFKIISTVNYTITASAGSNGSISPTGAIIVTSGSNRTFTITPNSGYQVDNVLVNGTSVGAVSTYTFNNVTSNQTISATFKVVSNIGSCLLTRFGVPRTTPLPSRNASYNKVYTLGTNAPNLSNVTNAVINWSLENNGLWQLSFNTNNGIPTWWLDMRNSVQNFVQASPAITFNGTGITNLDGNKYFVNYVDTNNVAFVEITGKHAFYFSNSTTPPAGCSSARLVINNRNENLQLNAYPNPSSDFINIEIFGMENSKQLFLYDSSGKIILEKYLPSKVDDDIIDLSNLSNGLYLIMIKSEENVLIQKIMKE